MVIMNLFGYINQKLTEPDSDGTDNDISEMTNYVMDNNCPRANKNRKTQVDFKELKNKDKKNPSKRPNLLSMIAANNMVSMVKAFSKLNVENSWSDNQMPFITERISSVFKYPIKITSHKIDFQPHKSGIIFQHYTNNLYSKEDNLHYPYTNKLKDTLMTTGAIECINRKRLKLVVQIAVVEEMFTKELQNCYYIIQSRKIVLLSKETHHEYRNIHQQYKPFSFFSYFGWHDYSSKGDTDKQVSILPRKNKNSKLLCSITSMKIREVFSSETLQTDDKGESLQYRKHIKYNVPTNKEFLRSGKSPFKRIQNKGVDMKTVFETCLGPKDIEILEHTYCQKQNQIYLDPIRISKYNNGANLDKLINKQSRILKKPNPLNMKTIYPAKHSYISKTTECNKPEYGNKKHNLQIPKPLSCSLRETTSLKFRQEIKRIQQLITNPLLLGARTSDTECVPNATDIRYGTLKQNTYNEWLLSSFPIGLTKSDEGTMRNFSYKFSLYIPENERCDNLFLEFYDIKSTVIPESQFQQWCMEKCQYNTMELYDVLMSLPGRQTLKCQSPKCQDHILRVIARRYNCLVAISDRFIYDSYGQFRAIQFVGGAETSVLACIKYFSKDA